MDDEVFEFFLGALLHVDGLVVCGVCWGGGEGAEGRRRWFAEHLQVAKVVGKADEGAEDGGRFVFGALEWVEW